LQLFGPVVLVVGLAVFVQGVSSIIATMDDTSAPAGADFVRFLAGFLAFGIGLGMTTTGFKGGLRG